MKKLNLAAQAAEFVKKTTKNGGKPLYELTPQEARNVLREVQKSNAAVEDAFVEEIKVELNNGRSMRVLIVKPDKREEPLPAVFYIHGGGWVMGDEITHGRLIRLLARKIPAAVIFPIYTPSPEAQYPQTTDDLFAVLQHIAEYGPKYNIDSERLAVAGDSVGGNMATVLALQAKKNGNLPPIDFQLLFYPVTNAEPTTSSYEEFADGPWLTRKAMAWFWKQYAPDKSARKEIFASPLKASADELQGLPPALIITAENDVLRDEGEAYAVKLNEAGVTAAAVRINGIFHDFMMLNDLADSAPTQASLNLAVETLRLAFQQPRPEKANQII